MSYKTEISKLLKADYKFRKKKSFYRIKNLEQLAEIWNVSVSTVYRKLNGRSLITREELETYAYNFHRDSDWINEIQDEAVKRAKEEKMSGNL